MKTNSLIIDLRRQLPWHKRYASTTSTAMMWAAWVVVVASIRVYLGIG